MKLNHLFAAVCCGLLAVSCQEEELGFSQEEVFRGAYGRNFEKKFGAIDPNQSWDFSSDATRAAVEKIPYVTVADTTGADSGYYVVDQSTLDWMIDKLKEGENHTSITRPFSLKWEPGCIFEIIPIYQGQAGLTWDFHIVINGEDHNIWSKGQGMQKKTSSTTSWSNIGTGSSDNTLNAVAVRAEPIILEDDWIENCPTGAEVYFYLEVTNGDDKYALKGEKQSSLKSMICMLDCPSPKNVAKVNPDYDSYLLGCEDATRSGGDWDYNDIVFLVTGYVPTPIFDDGKEEVVVSKRYLVEDLSSVADFDFNDVVVDVKQTTTTFYTRPTDQPNTWIKDENHNPNPEVRQEATVRWICGTIPFQVQVGNTCFGWVSDPMGQQTTAAELMQEAEATPYTVPEGYKYKSQANGGYQPKQRDGKPCTKQITGWDPDENNIVVRVCWDNTTTNTEGTTWTNTFPVKGEVPFMVATDITDSPNWTSEGHDIDEETWWKRGYISTKQ